MVRALHDLQRPHLNRAIVQRNPDGVTLRVASHKPEILMSVHCETLAMRKNQAADRFGMNQQMISDQRLHHVPQRGVMRQSMKRGEIENLLVRPLEIRIRVSARSRMLATRSIG